MPVRLNEDSEHVSCIMNALRENDGYCPCAVEKTQDTKCMCRDFRQQIIRRENGACHCGLYVFDCGDNAIERNA